MNNPSPSVPPSPTSPNSSVWSNISAVFSEDERPVSVGPYSLAASVSPPLASHSEGASSMGARARLVFDDDDDNDDNEAVSATEERRDTAASPAPVTQQPRAEIGRRESWSKMLAASAAPAAAAVALAVDNSASVELAALKAALSAARKEAAEAKCGA